MSLGELIGALIGLVALGVAVGSVVWAFAVRPSVILVRRLRRHLEPEPPPVDPRNDPWFVTDLVGPEAEDVVCALSGDGTTLAVSSRGRVTLWRLPAATQVSSFPLQDHTCGLALALNHDGGLLADRSGPACRELRVYATDGGDLLGVYPDRADGVAGGPRLEAELAGFALAPPGDRLMAVLDLQDYADDGTPSVGTVLVTGDPSGPARLGPYSGTGRAVVLAPDGGRVAVGMLDATAEDSVDLLGADLSGTGTGQLRLDDRPGSPYAFSADGSLLVTALRVNGRVDGVWVDLGQGSVWDLTGDTAVLLARWERPSTSTSCGAVGPVGVAVGIEVTEHLANHRKLVELRDLDGRLVRELPVSARWLAFSGRLLVVAGPAGEPVAYRALGPSGPSRQEPQQLAGQRFGGVQADQHGRVG